MTPSASGSPETAVFDTDAIGSHRFRAHPHERPGGEHHPAGRRERLKLDHVTRTITLDVLMHHEQLQADRWLREARQSTLRTALRTSAG